MDQMDASVLDRLSRLHKSIFTPLMNVNSQSIYSLVADSLLVKALLVFRAQDDTISSNAMRHWFA